ncbi:MAG: DUF108 domain-containing protein [Candidatus Omnitrophica bacterium]|nr:DUF108 domain-containing protein [Candidatus Omnitrophota bacterium]
MLRLKVGLIGCGTIGSSLAQILSREFPKVAQLRYLCDHHPEKAAALQRSLKVKTSIASSLDLIRQSDLIIEAASASISGDVALQSLKQGKQVLIMSVGGLVDENIHRRLGKIQKGKLWIPSGAIAGVDGLLASSTGELKRVRLVTRKPPQGLQSAPYFKTHPFPKLKNSQEVRVFCGKASEAVKAFPQNINVAAVLSLAGLGPHRTEVEIWTSLRYKINQHEVFIESDSGKIQAVAMNLPAKENPKTSQLAIRSAHALLRKVFSNIRIGT